MCRKKNIENFKALSVCTNFHDAGGWNLEVQKDDLDIWFLVHGRDHIFNAQIPWVVSWEKGRSQDATTGRIQV